MVNQHPPATSRQPLFTTRLSPSSWIRQHQAAYHICSAPRDRRLPAFVDRLARHASLIRHSLELLRIVFQNHPERYADFLAQLSASRTHFWGDDLDGALPRLVRRALSRSDWRERDLLEMSLDYLGQASMPEALDPGAEIEALERLRAQDPGAYETTMAGLISEARGLLPGLIAAHQALRSRDEPFQRLDANALQALGTAVAGCLGVDPLDFFPSPVAAQDPARLWQAMFDQAAAALAEQRIRPPLKIFEKATLYLLESLPLRSAGHAGFVRHLIEEEEAYRRLLATCYAPLAVQDQRLGEEMERYNRLPENAAVPVSYDDKERRNFLFAFFLRPDVVEAIAERERVKAIYQAVPGLGSRAHLPRVLHEVQNVFGYIVPESFDKIVSALDLDAVDVIRVIASYKQYSVDPKGSILIYICKGTACFLRGQPELSRRMIAEIEAEENEVGRYGVQFIEMDCFGVCHLAPVVKTEDRFLGNQRAENIPRLLQQLRQGPHYDNRLAFVRRILERLAPQRSVALPAQMRVQQLLCENPAELDPADSLAPAEILGRPLNLKAGGEMVAETNGHHRYLGRLIPNSLGFRYRTAANEEKIGCLLVNDAGQIQKVIHFPAYWLENELANTLNPEAMVEDGYVWVRRADDRVRLGPYTDQVLVLQRNERYWLLVVDQASGSLPSAEPQHGGSDPDSEKEDFIQRQDRLVLGFAAAANPDDIESYLGQGGYESVYRVLGLRDEPAWKQQDIIDQILEARLRGRGGAGFPTGRKWNGMLKAQCRVLENDENQDPIKLIVANGDEGDPGAFMDRTLIQERPHQLIEGMIIAAIAVGARYGVIYVRKEYEDAVRRLEHALFQARRKGFLGQDIFGVEGLHFDLEIRLGAGAFVAGEKRAIMRAIEGKPAEPTLKAVSNTVRGLWGKPTLLNNVETFANVPLILRHGGRWYHGQGTEKSGGSKIFSVAGIVNQTGLVEVRFGRTLHDIIRICDGIQEGKVLAGVQIGGPSGAILSLTGVRAYLLDTPLDFDSFNQTGAMLGSGGLVFIGEDDDVVRLARHFTDWLADESCGQCPACFRGTSALGKTLDSILIGEGDSRHIHRLWAQSDSIRSGSQCGLGSTAANPVTSALRFFPHAFFHAVLANPRLNALECFRTLEALRLLTREDVVRVRGSKREVIGYSFTLRKHLFRYLVTVLERLDRYRPAPARRTPRFLDLMQVPAEEVGLRDITLETTPEEVVVISQ